MATSRYSTIFYNNRFHIVEVPYPEGWELSAVEEIVRNLNIKIKLGLDDTDN